MRRILIFGTAVVTAFVTMTASSSAQDVRTPDGWVGTWATAPGAAVANTPDGYPNYSIRNVVHTSVGGSAARVRLANTFGEEPLTFGHVTIAVAAEPGSARAVAGTMRDLTFGGAPSVVVPAGAEVVSDEVVLDVPADGDLLVTTFTPTPSGPVTYHEAALQESFFTRDGDVAAEESGASYNERTGVWHYVAGVDVRSPAEGVVVTLGDSITDGVGSVVGANHRWPDLLSDRLDGRYGVLNAGIGGNRLLLDGPGGFGRNALARFADDVLSVGGVRTLIVLEGINDIQQEPHQTDPNALISAYRQLITQAHAHGIRVLGATITPFKGWGAWTEELESVRVAANEFIRTGGAFDGVVDFDAAVRDPADPQRILPAYDCGDALHPNDAGYQAMADAVDLSLL
jgi:lysophospholipase L1-like esterase